MPVSGQELVELAKSVLLGALSLPDKLDLGHLLVRVELGVSATFGVRHIGTVSFAFSVDFDPLVLGLDDSVVEELDPLGLVGGLLAWVLLGGPLHDPEIGQFGVVVVTAE